MSTISKPVKELHNVFPRKVAQFSIEHIVQVCYRPIVALASSMTTITLNSSTQG